MHRALRVDNARARGVGDRPAGQLARTGRERQRERECERRRRHRACSGVTLHGAARSRHVRSRSAATSAAAPPYGVTWDTTGVSDGLYSVWAVATDAATLTADFDDRDRRARGQRRANGVDSARAGAFLHATHRTRASANATDGRAPGVTAVEFYDAARTAPRTRSASTRHQRSPTASPGTRPESPAASTACARSITDGAGTTGRDRGRRPCASTTRSPSGTLDVAACAQPCSTVSRTRLSATASDARLGRSVGRSSSARRARRGPWTAIGTVAERELAVHLQLGYDRIERGACSCTR